MIRALFATLVLAFASSVATADTIVVPPEDADLIQYLINVAVNDGDVIQLEAGTYMVPGTINTNGLAITIRGAVDGEGYPTSILDGSGKHMVLQCNSGEDTSTEFRDLVIANGNFSGGGGGMLCSGSSPSLINCVFTDNASGSQGGGGMYCGNASPTLTSCTFMNNATTGYGGGMYCRDNSFPAIHSCAFIGNTAAVGGGIYNYAGSRPNLVACVVRENVALSGGGGIHSYFTQYIPRLEDTMVCQNTPVQIQGGYEDNGGNIVQDICTCFADISNTGEVGGADLGILLLLWESDNPVADLNDDGIVDGGDLGLVLLNWGPCP